MGKESMIRDMGYYSLAKVVLIICSFITLPIISKELGTSQYGVWSQITTTVSLIGPFVSMGMPQAFLRFFSHSDDQDGLAKGFYTLLLTCLGAALMVAVVLAALSGPLAEIVFSDRAYSEYFLYIGALIILSTINFISVMYFRTTNRIRTYSLLTVLQSIMILAAVVILLYRGNGIWGVVVGNVLGHAALTIFSLTIIVSQIGLTKPDFSSLARYVRFGLPLVPNSLVGWITDLSDRYLVGIMLGMSAVGIYSAAYSAGSLIDNFLFIIQVTLLPNMTRLHERGETKQAKTCLRDAYRYYLLIAIPSAVGLSFLAEPLLLILTTSEFVSGALIVPVVAIASVMKALSNLTSNVAFIEKKTGFILKVQIIGAVLNIVLNIILIPTVGLMGAAFATLVSYTAVFIVYKLGTRGFMHVGIDMGFVMKAVLSSAVMGLAVLMISPEGLSELLVTVVIGASIYMMIMFVLRGFTPQEVSQILAKIR